MTYSRIIILTFCKDRFLSNFMRKIVVIPNLQITMNKTVLAFVYLSVFIVSTFFSVQ